MTILGHEIILKVEENNEIIDFDSLNDIQQDGIVMNINDNILEGSEEGYGKINKNNIVCGTSIYYKEVDSSLTFTWSFAENEPMTFEELKETIASFNGRLDVSQINELEKEVQKLHEERIKKENSELLNQFLVKECKIIEKISKDFEFTNLSFINSEKNGEWVNVVSLDAEELSLNFVVYTSEFGEDFAIQIFDNFLNQSDLESFVETLIDSKDFEDEDQEEEYVESYRNITVDEYEQFFCFIRELDLQARDKQLYEDN